MEQQVMAVVPALSGVLLGLVFGAAGVWLWMRHRTEVACNQVKSEDQIDITRLTERLLTQRSETDRVTDDLSKLTEKWQALLGEKEQISNQLVETRTKLEYEIAQGDEKRRLLTHEFESIANRILEDKTDRFTRQNKTNLDELLGPLKTKLDEFKTKVEEVYVTEGNARSALGGKVDELMRLNQRLSEDAHNLTLALKGSTKTQGNWGEFILERVLELSGLRKGHEYELRETYKREDGRRAQPDVVIHLPEDRHLVVDAKVSLTAYEEHANAGDDAAREAALGRHLDSVRRHIKELSEKNYQSLYELKSVDFVLMFIPVEPAFMLAIAQDSSLWESAWKKSVLLVSPSTCLFAVRTVANLWQQEQQKRSVKEIALRGAALYDKLAGFVEDFVKIEERLKQARDSYDSAYNKLSRGQGNVIRQAEMLRDLGIRPSKSLPPEVVELPYDEPLTLPGMSTGLDGDDATTEKASNEAASASVDDILF